MTVASPCKESWEAMSGDARTRFCGRCRLNVYNLSDMTLDEVEDLVRRAEGRLCVRFFRRADGTVLTRDCPVGWRRRLVRRLAAAAGILAGVFAILFVAAADTSTWSPEAVVQWFEDLWRPGGGGMVMGEAPLPPGPVPPPPVPSGF